MKRFGYDVYMNGIGLTSLIPKLHIASVEIAPASVNLEYAEMAGRSWQRLQKRSLGNATVKVGFVLEKIPEAERQEALQKICAWAMEGLLEVSGKPLKQMRVVCAKLPYVSDEFTWSTPMTIEFQSTDRGPFWEEKIASVLSLTGTTGTGTLYVPGNAGGVCVEVTATPAATLSSLSMTVGNTTISLTGLSAGTTTPITIQYDDRGIQRIMCGTTSILDKRTGADDLIAECGKGNAVSYTADASVSIAFSARGAWL